MDRFPEGFLQPFDGFRRDVSANRRGEALQDHSESRQFSFQPIVSCHKQVFGAEALFRAGWDDASPADVNATSRIMLDNWLLYGFDDLNDGQPVFLKCTRNILTAGLLSLLPRSAVLEIQESIEPDEQVLSICRSLKAAGYRFALDDFEAPEKMEPFLHLVSFIKVDYRHPKRRERASMLRRLRLTGASLIADKIECEEEFQDARADGYGLFQGSHLGESISFLKKRDLLNPLNCMRILEDLHERNLNLKDLARTISLEPGIECRLLRRANWVTPANVVINSIREALEVVERVDIQMLVGLAMAAAAASSILAAYGSSMRNPLRRGFPSLRPVSQYLYPR